MGLGDWWDNWLSDPLGNTASGIESLLSTGSTGNRLIDLGLGYGLDQTGFANPKNLNIGYQGSVPEYAPVRERVPTESDRRAGGKNQRYFTDLQFAKNPDASAPTMQQAKADAALQRASLAQRNKMATGGIAMLNQGRYLSGSTDGMADVVPARIDGQQEARLSDGEFVIPADVVSHLGNGNSGAGAKQLHNMMDTVRKARTGRKEQGKEIKPQKFMPKMKEGGIAKFQEAGFVEAPEIAAEPRNVDELDLGKTTGTVNTLSPYVGPYVTEMLGRGKAIADLPFESFEGDISAGPSTLQQQAYTGIGGLQTPANMGVNRFDTTQATQYMNPYLDAALQPQIDAARRQAEIQRVADAGRLTKAGAFGGSRQAVMEAEGNRALQDRIAQITGEGYRDAFNRAQQQFNEEQAARNRFGFDVLAGKERAGAAQRDIEQQGLTADLAQFEEERDFPYRQVQYMQSLLQGLPLQTQEIQYSEPSSLSSLIDIAGGTGGVGGFGGLYDILFGAEDRVGDNPNPETVPVTDLGMTTAEIDALN